MIFRQSQLFTKTLREAPSGEEATNAKLLERGGFIYKNSAGVYTLLPLGWRVIEKIAQIIREEMNAIGGQELFMPALVEKKYWQATNRFDVDIGFEVKGKKDKEASFVLGWSHEDILSKIATRFIGSYKDLPLYVYQIQTKFRNEPRAKSGLLRAREFLMKDLYSFHASEADLADYYNKVAVAYKKIFERMGLKAIYTLAAGGEFTASQTHEFQVISPVGEDTIFVCQKCEYAENSEISKLKPNSKCPKCGGKIAQEKAIEVGNIFPLGTKYSEAVDLKFTNEKGEKKFVIMGSYGIGLGRVMATVVEVYNDKDGIIWPTNLAPYDIHIIELTGTNPRVRDMAQKAAESLQSVGGQELSILYDDRKMSAGEKFADRDLIGIPVSVIVSEKGFLDNTVEVVWRKGKTADRVDIGVLSSYYSQHHGQNSRQTF